MIAQTNDSYSKLFNMQLPDMNVKRLQEEQVIEEEIDFWNDTDHFHKYQLGISEIASQKKNTLILLMK